jgi:hypothetical protein
LGRGKRFIWKAMKAKKMEAVTNKDHVSFLHPRFETYNRVLGKQAGIGVVTNCQWSAFLILAAVTWRFLDVLGSVNLKKRH